MEKKSTFGGAKSSLKNWKLFSIIFLFFANLTFSQVANYSFSKAADTYAALVTPTTAIATSTTQWDDNVVSIPIGFTFNFNNVDYTTCNVSSNGFISFGATAPATNNYTPISNNSGYSGAISGLGIDLLSNGTTGGNISYKTTGAVGSRIFTVQFLNAYRYNIAGAWNFQIILNETTNKIKIIYGSCAASNTGNGYTAQIGLVGAISTDFNNLKLSTTGDWSTAINTGTTNASNVITRNTSLPLTGQSYTFTPSTCVSPTNFTAYNVGSTSANLSWTAATSTPSGGYEIYYNTSGTTPLAGTTPASTFSNTVTVINFTSLSESTTYYVWIRSNCGGSKSYWIPVTFTTSCIPVTSNTASNTYINKISFLGTLNDVVNASTYSTTTPGFQDFTALANKSSQAQGEGMNIKVENSIASRTKAWVDWNKDGNFNDSTEKVYDSNLGINSTTFGIIIPPSTLPGNYKIRIRSYRYYDYTYGIYYNDYDFNACETFDGSFYPEYGEAEDYTFNVIYNCSAKITSVSDGQNCAVGVTNVPVTISATGSTGVTQYKFYNAETGGSLIGTSSTGSLTVNINTTTVYWVTASNGSCESVKRTKVIAVVNPTPTISFNSSTPTICGEATPSIVLTASGDIQTVNLINENFNSGLGVFSSTINTNNTWQNKASVYKPTGLVWFPAIGSLSQGNFAYTTSDLVANITYNYETALQTTSTYNTNLFTNLTLKFEAYFSYYGGSNEGFFVEAQSNGGTWQTVQSYLSNLGDGTKFKEIIIPFDAFINVTNLKIRFRYKANWNDGVAIDNIKLYGDKPLPASFAWTSASAIFAADCVSAYSAASSSVCIKPTNYDIENSSTYSVTAAATLSSGCSATGTINITNNSKVWNNASTDWNATLWKPGVSAPPDATKCVIIKTPVILDAATNGLAKNLTVKTGGNLQIAGNLTVTDFVKNESSNADDFTVKSDGNLFQINPSKVINSGSINAERSVTDMDNVLTGTNAQMDYVYWSSPVTGQITKGTAAGAFSPGTPPNRFFSYLESNDRFYETGDLTFQAGRGYAVRAEISTLFPVNPVGYNKTYNFRGTPNNGDFSWLIVCTDLTHGFNLVGNPYPSNIKFDELYLENSSLIWNTAYFWTNNSFIYAQQGSSYSGNNYAIYNGTGGNSATRAALGTGMTAVPNGIVKVGQGFLVQKKAVGSGNLNFKNSYSTGHDLRVATTGTFFQKGTSTKNRFWINLISPDQMTNTQLIGYIPGSTNDYEQDFDAEILGMSSDVFYSKLADKMLLIQGRDENFHVTDKVDIGANFFKNGTYTIALDTAEGIFNGSQSIYLKDKVLGTLTNLSTDSYTFQATKGLTDGRFEILYQPEITLGTGSVSKENLQIYRDSGDFVIKATQKISEVELYDASGRLIIKLKPNSAEARIAADKLINGVFVVKIKLSSGEIVTRKIRK